MANCMVRGSAKELHYFWVVSPMESNKIMGLKGIHSCGVLKHQTGGTMVNHHHTGHYHPRLICK